MKSVYLIASIALLTAACAHDKKDKTAATEPPLIDVSQVEIDSVTIYKEYPATLTANLSADVYCRVNGYVSAPHYNGGDLVQKGQLLFTISAPDLQNAVTEAEAALQTAISENEYAEQHYLAVAKAYESQAVSKMEVAQALSSRDQSRASINSARAQLTQARETADYCNIRAPFTGHITSNIYSAGSYISGAGSPVALATVYDDSRLTANYSIEDASFLRMFENPEARDGIDYSAIPVAFSEDLPHTYTANLTYMAPNVNNSTGTLALQGGIDNPYGELRPGMYCTVRMPFKVDPEAILVKDASIGTDQLGKYVYVVNDSSKVVYTPIKTGDLVADTMRLVTEGLKPGDRYVTSAMLKVRDGMTVRTTTANPSTNR